MTCNDLHRVTPLEAYRSGKKSTFKILNLGFIIFTYFELINEYNM